MIEKVKETKSLNLSASTTDRVIEANQKHGREHEGMNIETKSIISAFYLLINCPPLNDRRPFKAGTLDGGVVVVRVVLFVSGRTANKYGEDIHLLISASAGR